MWNTANNQNSNIMKRGFIKLSVLLSLAVMASCTKEEAPSGTTVSVTTSQVTEIGSYSAKGGGTVSSENSSVSVTEKGLCWSVSQNPTTKDFTAKAGKGLGDFTAEISPVEAGTTYYVRAYAVSLGKTVYGNQVSFTTEESRITVSTSQITEITQESAKGGGKVDTDSPEDIIEVGLCWNETGLPTIEDSYTIEDMAADGTFTSELTYLDYATTYYVRAYARTETAIGYGNEVTFTTVAEPAVDFTDQNFKNYMLENFDLNRDGQLQVSEAEEVTTVDLSSRSDITSIEGIKACVNLTKLFVGTTAQELVDAGTYNTLSSVDVSGLDRLEEMWLTHTGISTLNTTGCTNLKVMHALQNNLESVDLSTNVALAECHLNENPLASLDLKNNVNLKNVGVILTQVKSIDLSGNTSILNFYGDNGVLQSLDFSGCTSLLSITVNNDQVSSLNVSGCTNLTTILMDNNKLSSVDLSGCPALSSLHLVNNSLPSIDLSANPALSDMHLNGNPIETLDLTNNPNLINLGIISTGITSLDLSGRTSISGIWGEGAALQSLDLEGCTGLNEVYVNNNQISEINVKGCTKLRQLHMVSNKLTSIDVTENPALTDMHLNENQLTSIDLSGCPALLNLGVINNQLTALDVSGNPALTGLWPAGNPIKSLDVSKCAFVMATLDLTNTPELTTLIMKRGQTVTTLLKDDSLPITYVD